jgi:hypothetical protein
MSYVTQETIWPVAVISPAIQHVIATFYELADSKDVDAGARMAKEVFTPDATLIAASGTFRGAERGLWLSLVTVIGRSEMRDRDHEEQRQRMGRGDGKTTRNFASLRE